MKRKTFIKLIVSIILITTLSLGLYYGNYKLSDNSLNTKNIKLIANNNNFENVYNEIYINKNKNVIKSYETIEKRANEILEEPMCEYKIDEGNRMLNVSRKCKETIETLGFIIKIMELNNKNNEQIQKYSTRAINELINVCKFQDWHPNHFLDTAEMTYSVALGYNWMYDYLSKEEKDIIQKAIINNGLIAGISSQYTSQFVNKNNNWNPICNGALAIGAIALLKINENIELKENDIDYNFQKNYLKINENEISENKYKVTLKKLCQAIIYRTIDKIPLVYEEMQDGAYEEGILYWEYGNTYLINFLSTLKLSFGKTFNLVDDTYLKNTILYPVYLTGKSSVNLPESKVYNYGDADENIVNTSASTWLANQYYKDEKLSKIVNWYQENYFETQNIYQLLWQNYKFSFKDKNEQEATLNDIADKKYQGTEIAILQKNILDKKGFYIATKAGKNSSTNHSDLDAGSFILDAKGTRWIEDSGREYYNVNKYWDKSYIRWTYYKKRAESHSTIVLDTDTNEDQKINADCKIINFISNNNKSSVELDISEAYNFDEKTKNEITRKILLDKEKNKILIEDNIKLENNSNIYSMFNISSNTSIVFENDKKTAILKKNVLQDNGAYKEESLIMNIINTKYEWTIMRKEPIKPSLKDVDKNPDYKYNLTNEEEKLCIKIENGKEEKINIEIY